MVEELELFHGQKVKEADTLFIGKDRGDLCQYDDKRFQNFLDFSSWSF